MYYDLFYFLFFSTGKAYVVYNVRQLHLEPYRMPGQKEITVKGYGNDALYHFSKLHVNPTAKSIKGNATQPETLGERSPACPLHRTTQQITAKKQLLPLEHPVSNTLQRSLRSLKLTIWRMQALKSSGSDFENHNLCLTNFSD